jgi:poly(3-hydroxybutyrate) depolymerase
MALVAFDQTPRPLQQGRMRQPVTRQPLATLPVLAALVAACGVAGSSPGGSVDPSTPIHPSVSSSSASASEPAKSGEQTAVVAGTNGAPLGHLEYLPPNYGEGEPRPLLVFLHGAGEAGDGSEDALKLVDDLGVPELIASGAWALDQPFVVLSPQYGTEYAESDCDFGGALAAFIDYAVGHYDVDPSRVYLTGVSCGAIGIWDYFASHAADDVVAATVTVSGHGEWAFEEAGCELAAMPPMWALHGAADDVVPVVHIARPIEQIGACDGADPASLELTILPDADHVTAIQQAYDSSRGNDVFAWLLGHANDSAP